MCKAAKTEVCLSNQLSGGGLFELQKMERKRERELCVRKSKKKRGKNVLKSTEREFNDHN